MSNTAGSHSDLVQGGGGNTSVKLDDAGAPNAMMAIKASGFCLAQITKDNAFAVLDYAAIRKFYAETDPATLGDVEKEGAAAAKAATLTIDGLPQLRPSVEAGFHSILDKFVLHIHPVYANMATCSAEGAEVVKDALAGMPETHAFVPYVTPGTTLTFTIQKARADVETATGKKPQIIFMQNHGLILTGDTANECLRLSEAVNKRIAKAYGVKFADWPQIEIKDAGAAGEFVSATPWLRARLMKGGWDLDFFCKQSLYPDQLVFLAGQLGVVEKGRASKQKALPVKATI
ncbi:MAG: class II aldolase/adducin family protein, partial [Kiritimatiellaeota bacterium]|nr:class II aldolase/adducin family protein [Kiritimatiellota bacterium]